MSDNNSSYVGFVAEYSPFDTGEDSNLFSVPISARKPQLSGQRIRTTFVPQAPTQQPSQTPLEAATKVANNQAPTSALPSKTEASPAPAPQKSIQAKNQPEQNTKTASVQSAKDQEKAKLFINRQAKAPDSEGTPEMKTVPVRVSSIDTK